MPLQVALICTRLYIRYMVYSATRRNQSAYCIGNGPVASAGEQRTFSILHMDAGLVVA
jgi:hypothetical protein